MQERKGKIDFRTANNGAEFCRSSLPHSWVVQMGADAEHNDTEMSFDGDVITIQRPQPPQIKHAPLASNKRIHVFAQVWEQMYRNYRNIPGAFFENIEFVGEGLADLGFEMDCGKSFDEAYPETGWSNGTESFREIVKIVTDTKLLGDAIFSQWRWWNHWANAPMKDDDYEWFILAFGRLAELTK